MRLVAIPQLSVIALLFLWPFAFADGYRPESVLEEVFVKGLGEAHVTVYPTVVRDKYRVSHSTASQQAIIDYFHKHELASVGAADRKIELGLIEHRPQFELFMDSMRKIADQVSASHMQSDYALVLEVLFPPSMGGRAQVFGIQVYILTVSGDNAFSFLLNSHHASFRRAGLYTSDTSAAGRERLVMKSTAVALAALKEQLTQIRSCAPTQGRSLPMPEGAGVVDDFESRLPAATDANGIQIGFSSFTGSNSKVWMSITDEHPPLPDEAIGNRVLKVDVDVHSWAGVLHRFADVASNEWIAYDWRGARELSFWLYGNDSGTTLVVDVLDNRHRCSIRDDAERYRYEFPDNFSGWKLIAIPFDVMIRTDTVNGAPDDGLGLASVTGWAFSALKSFGAKTYYLDDIRVRQIPVLESTPVGEFRDRYIWSPINELPMYGGFSKTAGQQQADEEFLATVLPRFDDNRTVAAERFARMGWNLYYQDNRSSAIKRFNQAWLLDAGNQHALWGFAVISRDRGKRSDALRYYEMALAKGVEQAKLREEYEQLRRIPEATPDQAGGPDPH